MTKFQREAMKRDVIMPIPGRRKNESAAHFERRMTSFLVDFFKPYTREERLKFLRFILRDKKKNRRNENAESRQNSSK